MRERSQHVGGKGSVRVWLCLGESKLKQTQESERKKPACRKSRKCTCVCGSVWEEANKNKRKRVRERSQHVEG